MEIPVDPPPTDGIQYPHGRDDFRESVLEALRTGSEHHTTQVSRLLKFYLIHSLKLSGDFAEECTSEAFRRLLADFGGSPERLADKSNVGAFVRGIARNVAHEGFRQNKRFQGEELDQVQTRLGARNPRELNPCEMKLTVEELMTALDSREEAVVRSRYIDDRSYDDIAKGFGLTPANVRQIVCRAVSKMRSVAHRVSQSPGCDSQVGGYGLCP